MPCCSVVIVGVYSVSARLAVSGCNIHFRPVRLIRHSLEEDTGHRAFIACFLTEAELRNGLRSWWRDAVLISPALPVSLRPARRSSQSHILRTVLAQYTAWTIFYFIKHQSSVLNKMQSVYTRSSQTFSGQSPLNKHTWPWIINSILSGGSPSEKNVVVDILSHRQRSTAGHEGERDIWPYQASSQVVYWTQRGPIIKCLCLGVGYMYWLPVVIMFMSDHFASYNIIYIFIVL